MASKTKKSSRDDKADTAQQDTLRVSVNERIIKKYRNRRLYDTLTSTYIALSDVKQLVMEGVSFKVIDATSDQDLTRTLLLQIILEEEACGTPLFSEAVLANLIRSYGHAMQGFMGNYLDKNLQIYADLQSKFTHQSLTINETVQHALSPEAWTQQMNVLQEQMLALFGFNNPNDIKK